MHTHTHTQVDDSCVPNHLHERKVKGSEEDETSVVSELTLPEFIDEEELEADSGSEKEEQGTHLCSHGSITKILGQALAVFPPEIEP